MDDLYAPFSKDEISQVGSPKEADPVFAPFSKDEVAQAKGQGQGPQKTWLDKEGPLGNTPRGYIQGSLNVLPYAGAFGGGVLGSAGGPIGAVGGAGLGGGLGAGLKQLGEQHILGQDKQAGDYYTAEGKGIKSGIMQEAGGQVATKALKVVSDVPSLLKEFAKPEEAQIVYDPFIQTERAVGSSTDEMANLGHDFSQIPKGDQSVTQKAAGLLSRGIEKTGDVASKGAEYAGKAFPYVLKGIGALKGGFPGYKAAEYLGTPAAAATARFAKDAAGNVVMNPEGMGLLMRAAKESTEGDSKER
jgi:hypothetical protein